MSIVNAQCILREEDLRKLEAGNLAAPEAVSVAKTVALDVIAELPHLGLGAGVVLIGCVVVAGIGAVGVAGGVDLFGCVVDAHGLDSFWSFPREDHPLDVSNIGHFAQKVKRKVEIF